MSGKSHRLSYKGGDFHVYVQGSTEYPAIVTFHDVGLEHKSCFGGLFNYDMSQQMMKLFCVYHIDAPGQETGAGDLLGNDYPSITELARLVHITVEHFGLSRFVAMGSGVGCNVFLQYAEDYVRSKIIGMILFSPVVNKCGWYEWGYYKSALAHAKSNGYTMTSHLRDLFIHRYFGDNTITENIDMVQIYNDYLSTEVNVRNVVKLAQTYLRRPDQTKLPRKMTCRALIVTGSDAPCLNDVLETKGLFNSERSSWMEVSGCGSIVQEEQPHVLSNSLRLFLMGLPLGVATVSQLSQCDTK
eukprot:CFRG0624T1